MRRIGRRRALLAASLSLAGACTFSSQTTVKTHELAKPLPQGLVNSYNLEEQLERGFIPEVLEFFASAGPKTMESTRSARILGQALLERGDFRAGHVHLERAFAQEGRLTTRAETAWLLSQCDYWTGDFASSARWARVSQSEGRRIPDGWVVFLASIGEARAYGGAPVGARLGMAMTFGRPDLVRLLVKVNDGPPDLMVLDSGASISLLTESAARRFGVELIPDAVAGAYGLHEVEIPLHFGWARSVELAGLKLTNVPFGILADEALTFQTASAGRFNFAGVLGVHFLKEFDWRLEYPQRRVRAIRLDAAQPRGSRNQNLFFRRLKPMVRASFNRQPWFLFLLDTGSEPTMVTRSGLRRARSTDLEASYPMTLEGIGKSRVSWSKMSDTTVGVDRYMVQFKDIVVKEENVGLEDGVLGSSFLSHFDVELRFGAMTVSLERPFDRLLREQEQGIEPYPPMRPLGATPRV